jgi:hypothetical protein
MLRRLRPAREASEWHASATAESFLAQPTSASRMYRHTRRYARLHIHDSKNEDTADTGKPLRVARERNNGADLVAGYVTSPIGFPLYKDQD